MVCPDFLVVFELNRVLAATRPMAQYAGQQARVWPQYLPVIWLRHAPVYLACVRTTPILAWVVSVVSYQACHTYHVDAMLTRHDVHYCILAAPAPLVLISKGKTSLSFTLGGDDGGATFLYFLLNLTINGNTTTYNISAGINGASGTLKIENLPEESTFTYTVTSYTTFGESRAAASGTTNTGMRLCTPVANIVAYACVCVCCGMSRGRKVSSGRVHR